MPGTSASCVALSSGQVFFCCHGLSLFHAQAREIKIMLPCDAIGAAGRGDLKRLKQILRDSPSSVAARDTRGRNCGHYAAQEGHTHILELIHLHTPAVLAQLDDDLVTCAHFAAALNRVDCINFCARAGLVEQVDKDGWSVAHYAARNGHADVLECLVKAGWEALLTLPDSAGWLPLHFAAHNGRAAAFELLVAKAPRSISTRAANGWVAAHFAAARGHAHVLAHISAEAGASASEAGDGLGTFAICDHDGAWSHYSCTLASRRP